VLKDVGNAHPIVSLVSYPDLLLSDAYGVSVNLQILDAELLL